MILDIVFSLDSVITAVGMANKLSVMAAAIVIAVVIMLVASKPLAEFVARHPTVKMLALSFMMLIGLALIADGAGIHVPKGYICAAIGFSVGVEALNQLAARRRRARAGIRSGRQIGHREWQPRPPEWRSPRTERRESAASSSLMTRRWREPDSNDRSLSAIVADPSRWRGKKTSGVGTAVLPGRDQRFESGSLQQAVCLSGERRDYTGKAPHFGGILRMAGDVRRDVQAANRASFALSL
jgi:hypothetical protein